MDKIIIRGARENNLKNINIDLPKNKLIVMTKQKGYSLVPLNMYFKGSLVKVELGVGKGKKLYDKRETIKERDLQRQAKRLNNY